MSAGRSDDRATPELATYQRRFLLAGGAGLVLSLVGWLFDPAQFFRSYLVAYLFALGATNGCLALAMIHQLSGGAWGVATSRVMGAATRVLPVLTGLFLPIAFGLPHLYEWTHPEVVAADEVLRSKAAYLNVPFFMGRAVLYFAVWNALAIALNRWALQRDRVDDPAVARRLQGVSGGGLVVFAITTTFASFDWMMSLDPHWYSTIYGVLVMGGQGLTAIATLIIASTWLSRREPMRTVAGPQLFHDLGNLMLAFVVLWAYFSFSQYLIIYSANLPEEITWYTYRLHTSWRALGVVLVLAHFAVPFQLLLSRPLKREPDVLMKVAVGIIVVRSADLFWLVAPQFHHDRLSVSWLDVVLLLAFASLWIGCFLRELGRCTLEPLPEPTYVGQGGSTVEPRGAAR